MPSSDPRASPPAAGAPPPAARVPAGVWVLGLGSLCMDASSELIHSLLPVFMAGVLGASMVTVGAVEGVGEAMAAFTKVFSGALSDRLGRRKGLLVLGYALGALSKPVFPLAGSIGWVWAARIVDRTGKGIRGAPRDALVADLAPRGMRGAAYGLRQALDSTGAVAGPLLALAGLAWFAGDIRAAMWIGVVPAVAAVTLLALGVREPARAPAAAPSPGPPLTLASARRLPRRYWLIVALAVVFGLSRFSEAFLILRAHEVGLALGHVPLVMVVMNGAYAALAYPAGAAADRRGPRPLLLAGLALLIGADLVLAAAAAPATALAGAVLWGGHLALTQGLFAKLVADAAPAELRGTAFGVFNLATGVALLLASLVAGALWRLSSAPATFLVGATLAGAAAVGLLAYRAPSAGGGRMPAAPGAAGPG